MTPEEAFGEPYALVAKLPKKHSPAGWDRT